MSDSTTKTAFVSTETGEIFTEEGAGRVETPLSDTGFPGASLDYLAGTLFGDEAILALKQCFGLEGWEEQSGGTKFYYHQCKRGNITLLWDGITAGMGTRFELSGQGCRELEGLPLFRGWPVMLAALCEMGARFTRVDVALDDHAGLLSLPIIREKMQKRELATHYKKGRGMWECSLADEEGAAGLDAGTAETLYLGRRDGMSMVRFYDWQAKHGGDESFVRCELELHKRYAHKLAERLAAGTDIGIMAASVIKAKVLFKEPGEEAQKTRWQTCEWWDKFLGAVEAVKLSVRPVAATLNRKLDWVMKSVAPTLAFLEEQAPEPNLIAQILAAGSHRLDRKGREYKRICSVGWKSDKSKYVDDADPFVCEFEEKRARLLFEYRASAALSSLMS